MFNFLYFNVLPNFSTVVPLRLLPRRDNSLLKSIQYDLLCFQKGISPFFFVAAKKRYVKTPFAATNKCYFVATYVIVRYIWFMIRFYFFHFSFLLCDYSRLILISLVILCGSHQAILTTLLGCNSRLYACSGNVSLFLRCRHPPIL